MSRSSPPGPGHSTEAFSLPLFLVTVAATLVALLGVLRFAFPGAWTQQLRASFGAGAAAFLAVSLVNCFTEYFFHRYLLHTPAIPLLNGFYRQHVLHHALTRIVKRRTADGRGRLTIENVFPIVEPSQGEASFFPWYTLAAFAAVYTPFLALAQCFLPSFPWFLSGFAALAASLALYELVHAVDHWPLARWEPLLESRRWGWFWRRAYAFHLRHHAVADCNEAISGFFGLPVADWIFGTCAIPETLYADGEPWSPDKFQSPRPRWPVRALDRWVAEDTRRRRDAAVSPARAASLAERLCVGATHGAGLALSVAALTLLIVVSSLRGDAWHVVSFTVFGIGLVTLHTALTLYHAWRSERGRWLMGRLRHVAGFILVAGTYTPFLLTNLRGPRSWTLFGVAWGLCGAGAVLQFVWGDRFRFSRALRWFAAGWLLAMLVKPMMASVSPGALCLLVAGGLCYGLGPLLAKRRELWCRIALPQGFAVLGGACHVLAALLFLLPASASAVN